MSNGIQKLLAAAAALVLLSACASTQRSIAYTDKDMHLMLAEAGFSRTDADTPKQHASIQTMPQGRVFPQPEGDRLFYIYADYEGCRCMYVGDEADYARFEEVIDRRGIERSYCIDERLYSIQAEPWRDGGGFEALCR